MDNFSFYQKAYKTLENSTPLYFDCGQLCDNRCCNDTDKGMYLFPGEQEYLAHFDHGHQIMDTSYSFKLLKCDGTCDRALRPLACMIFPLFPFVDKDKKVTIDFDPRAKGVCPLLLQDIKEIKLQPGFERKIKKFFKKAVKKHDPIYQYLYFLSQELETIKRLKG